MVIDNLICNTLLLIYGLVCACIGFFIATRKKPCEHTEKQAEPIPDDIKRKVEKIEKEHFNFLSYDGSEQK